MVMIDIILECSHVKYIIEFRSGHVLILIKEICQMQRPSPISYVPNSIIIDESIGSACLLALLELGLRINHYGFRSQLFYYTDQLSFHSFDHFQCITLNVNIS